MSKQTKIRQSARNEECQVRIEGYCNFNTETTVLAHLGGAGVAMKSNDIHSAYCCSSCHDVIDKRTHTGWKDNQIIVWFYDGMVRTQLILLKKGLIKAC